jgi:hypothetical protein
MSVHMVFVSVHSVLAIVTLLPMATASKPNLMGYKSLCSFNSFSALILFGLAGLHFYFHLKSRSKEQSA